MLLTYLLTYLLTIFKKKGDKLVTTFCQFFVDKVNRIRDNISQALQSSARRVFATLQSDHIKGQRCRHFNP